MFQAIQSVREFMGRALELDRKHLSLFILPQFGKNIVSSERGKIMFWYVAY